MTSDRDDRGREFLPIPDRPHAGQVTYDAKDPDTSYPPITPLRPPGGAPNVLVILLDDVGFGASSAFGGPVHTPTAERLAGNGLRHNRFHTTALCSPTRQALLTGRNHHSVGMGGITEIATSVPGYSSLRPNTAAPLAETLKLNGFSTAQFGKCHEVPVWQSSPMGPFDQWPTGSGFEHFYGFIGGETNQWAPAIYRDTVPVEPDRTAEEGYHFTEDMTDRAIDWVRQQKALMADKPFFVYFAPGGTHAPHHVAREWSDKYQGRFDQGWDQVREETFARQQAQGVIPPEAELTARPDEIPGWDEMPDGLKGVLARQMEVYAGFLEHTDHNVGRLVDALDELEVLDDTVLPLDDRRAERFNADIAGRPQLIRGNSQLLFGGMGRLSENSVLVIKNKSHSVTAQLVAPESGAHGVIVAQGGSFGGWALYAKDGRPAYCYNLFGLQRFKVEGDAPIPPGEHQVRMEFAYDGGGLAKGGSVSLYLDGDKVGEGRVDATQPMVFSADETTDVGSDSATPVSDDYGPKDSQFTGTVRWIQIDIDDAAEDVDHLITAEERLRVAMARQ
jgi:hypothetical protein